MSAIGVEAHIDQLLLTNLNLCPRGAKINFTMSKCGTVGCVQFC
jgi:hypothetical protein